ncbi:MAG: zf-HC2 domain-containing protein [bacterium]
MTKCKTNRDRLIEFYYGELGAQAQTALEDHLRICAGCRTEFERLQNLLNAIPPDQQAELPRGVRNRVRQGIRSRIRTPHVLPGTAGFPVSRWVPALVSLVAVLFVGILTFQSIPPKDSSQGNEVTEEEMEVAENIDLLQDMDLIEILDALEEMIQQPDSNPAQGGEL